METLRYCTKCDFKSDDLCMFVADPRYKHGRKNLCKRCWAEAQKDRQRKFRKSRREFLNELKDKPCADCNVSYPYYVMDFDHLRDKKFSLYEAIGQNYSIEEILNEAAKCDVVCSNCHRIRTHSRLETKYAG